MQPPELAVNDAGAVAALRSRLEAMSMDELLTHRQAVLSDLNSLPERRAELDRRVVQASKAIDEARLVATLDRKGAADLALKEEIAEAAIVERQRFRVEAARLEYVAGAIDARIKWLEDNQRYRAKAQLTPMWRTEYDQAVQDVRDKLARLVALYTQLHSIGSPSAVQLAPFVQTILETPEQVVSKAIAQRYAALTQEALAAWNGGLKDQALAEDLKAEGRDKAKAKQAKAQQDLNPNGLSVAEIIRS